MNVRELFDLTGKKALVTGGSRGLGLQMAKALAELGASVSITARKREEVEAAAKEIPARGLVCDLSNLDGIPAFADELGDVDILVNNAGTSWGQPAEEHPLEAWRKVLTLNVDAVFVLTQEIGRRHFLPRRSGKVVNVASIAGLAGNPPWMKTIAYNTSKGALVNFTRALAAEWGPYNVNVNCICPGFFPSKMTKGLLSVAEKQVLEMTPLGRLGGDEDLKGAVAYFASEASRHVTGQALVVDGGALIV